MILFQFYIIFICCISGQQLCTDDASQTSTTRQYNSWTLPPWCILDQYLCHKLLICMLLFSFNLYLLKLNIHWIRCSCVNLCSPALHYRRCTLRHSSPSDLCSTDNKKNLTTEDLFHTGTACWVALQIWCFACLYHSCERNTEEGVVLWFLKAATYMQLVIWMGVVSLM